MEILNFYNIIAYSFLFFMFCLILSSFYVLSYFLLRIINIKFKLENDYSDYSDRSHNLQNQQVLSTNYIKNKKSKVEPIIPDDLPFFNNNKIETNFGPGELGKNKDNKDK